MAETLATPPASPDIKTPPSALSPFKHTLFTVMWTATMVSLIGTWMNDIAAGWLMAEMTNSPTWVGLVQSALSLPIFLFALPAGALADLVERKKILAIVQALTAVAALSLWWVVDAGRITPPLLLFFAFLMGTGTSFIFPAWMAIIPQLVPKDKMRPAVALHSIAVNTARTTGPAVGGIIIAVWGISYPFLINSFTFILSVIGVLWCWKGLVDVRPKNLPTERFFAAMCAGLRFTRSSTSLKATLVNAFAYFFVASIYWALLPLIARNLLNGGPELYGTLMASAGVSALVTALFMPKIQAYFGMNKMVGGATAVSGIAIAMFAVAHTPTLGIVAAMLCGSTWIMVVVSYNVSAQVALPEWVRGRGLAVLQMVYFGAFAVGSIFWGRLADFIGMRITLWIAAGCAILIIGILVKWKLGTKEKSDLTPSGHWVDPIVAQNEEIEEDRDPVMVTMEYSVKPEDKEPFFAAIKELAENRRRDGAVSWGIFEDTETLGRFVETFYLESWLEHMRQQGRVTKADLKVEKIVHQYHQGKDRPVAKHFLAPKEPDTSDSE
jgi:MFS family permease